MTATTTTTHTVLDALRALSSVCDGARSEDNQGFNGRDTNFGKSLALQDSLSPKQEQAARKMLVTYTKQLSRYGIDVNNLATSVIPYEVYQAQKANTSTVTPAQPQLIQPVQPVQANRRKARLNSSHIVFSFSYDPTVKDSLKDTFRSARFDSMSKTWSIFASEITGAILWGKQWNFDVSALETALVAKLQAEHEAAQAADLAFQGRMKNIDLDNTGSIVLRAYQKDGVQFLVQRERAILADDMGLGKTLQALVASKAYKNHTIIVIAPKSIHRDWLDSAAKVNACIEIYTWAKIPESPSSQYLVIADEAHYAQNLKSARTQKLIALCEKATGVFLLTGTPIKNGRPVNLYPLLSIINHPLAKDKKAYEKRYCNAHATRFTQWDTTGAAFLEELNQKISDSLLRRTKKQCLPDLPEKTRVLRYVEPSVADQKAYHETFDSLRSDYLERLQAGKIQDGGEALVLLNHLRHAASIAKVGSAVELSEELLEQGESVVVFFEFTDSLERFISDPRISGYGVSYLSADLNADTREVVKQAFMSGQTKVFCTTIKTGGVGLTLTVASTVVLVDRPWTPGDAVQAEDRIHRIGQKNACTAYWLRYGHCDESIDTLLADKAEKIGIVLGDDTVKIDYANLASDIF